MRLGSIGLCSNRPVFAHFIYDSPKERLRQRGIPLWAGKIVSWLYPRLGGIPIHRRQSDSEGLRTARELLVNGRMPIAIAPEGAANGQSEQVSPLEPAAAQLGFWAMEDLMAAGEEEDVSIVPIGIQYYYIDEPWSQLEETIAVGASMWIGIDRYDSRKWRSVKATGDRCKSYSMTDFIGSVSIYSTKWRIFTLNFISIKSPNVRRNRRRFRGRRSPNRLQYLLDFALQVSESYFNLQPKGTKIDRCRRIEQAGWNWIYLEELTIPTNLSRQSVGNWPIGSLLKPICGCGTCGLSKASSPSLVLMSRIDRRSIDLPKLPCCCGISLPRLGGNEAAKRPQLGQRRVQMTICNPIPLSDYWDRYKSGRRHARQATIDLTLELQTSMEGTLDRGW